MATNKKRKISRIVLIVGVVLLVLLIILFALIPKMILGNALGKRIDRQVYAAEDYNVAAKEVVLTTEDSLDIASWLVEAEKPKGTVIILSGIENPSVTAFFGYARVLQQNGYNSLLIEMRAHNQSEGDQVYLGMKEWMDVKAGVNYIINQETANDLPIIVMGTSMGASTALISLGEIDRIDGVISISAFSSFADTFSDNMVMMEIPSFIATLEKPFTQLYLGLHYKFSDLSYHPMNAIKKINKSKPILFMHSTEDTQVPYQSFERLTQAAEKNNLSYTTFIRMGDHHFIINEDMFDTPEKDTEFIQTIIYFLDDNFN